MEISLNKIEQLRAELESLMPMSAENQAKLNKKFRLEFNYNSNHLEGNTLTYGETELLIYSGNISGNHKFQEYQEMKAHDFAIKIIDELAVAKETSLTEADIKQLNKIILVESFWGKAETEEGKHTNKFMRVGEYKTSENHVKLKTGEKHLFAYALDTPKLMQELIQWLNEKELENENPVILAALFHYKFVAIHPFDDGNGRIARLLMNYILKKNNLPPVVIKSSEKEKYLTALQKADAKDINSFIKYIANQLIWSLELSIKAAKGENLEEPNDYEKEISIWKNQFKAGKKEEIRRDEKVIHDLYITSLKTLISKFVEKHNQFSDLFQKCEYSINLNQNPLKDLDDLDFEMSNYSYEQNGIKWHVIPNDSLYKITLVIYFSEFKHNYLEPFSLNSTNIINFNEYNYIINFANKTITKPYSEFLNADEINDIVKVCVTSIFEQIKQKSGGNN